MEEPPQAPHSAETTPIRSAEGIGSPSTLGSKFFVAFIIAGRRVFEEAVDHLWCTLRQQPGFALIAAFLFHLQDCTGSG